MTAARRVLALASGGGHFVQLLRLRPAWDGHQVTYATVHESLGADVAPAPLLTFRDVSAADWWRLPLTMWDIARILVKVRPQIIITTGALPGLVALALSWPLGVRTLWVDSIANAQTLSRSGRHARRIATQVVTQWPALAEPGIDYWGGML